MFKGFNIFNKERAPKKSAINEEGQLLTVIGDLEQSPELFKFVISQLSQQSGQDPEEIKSWFKDVKNSTDALGLAKKIDDYLGKGTFRKLSFISKGADAERNILKILSRDLKASSFEGKAEDGLYLNIKENYGVEWTLEKAARDILQNFFDGNGQTLDGVGISTERSVENGKAKIKVKISGKQEYDWRELVHLGASSKTDSEIDAGGFGEGAKVLSLVLLRDYGAQNVRFASGEWELEFYIDQVPHGSYHKQEDKGLFVRKKKRKKQEGNSFQIEFEGEGAADKSRAIEDARQLFYSSENNDFKNQSFENKNVGGFSIVPREVGKEHAQKKGNLYIAGQRIHYNDRSEWNNVTPINIWTWRKIALKDRDRGMITSTELKKEVIPKIVEAMGVEEAQKSVKDFEPWYEKLVFYDPGSELLEAIVNKLEKLGIKMEFPQEYYAYDFGIGDAWIAQLLSEKGRKSAPGYMKKIGMVSGRELFKNLQEHNRVPETVAERQKIEILQEAAELMGCPEEDRKDVWIFSAEGEKNIIHGQYLPDFFWLAREVFNGKFFDALHTYIHEAAHKAGSHGNAKFEYTLQDYIKKIQLFMHERKSEYLDLEERWNKAK